VVDPHEPRADVLAVLALDEDEVSWWHWPETGFAGRTPLSDPPA
jgi:hypothetical protein